MSEFSAVWLALREPVDHAARSEALTRWVIDALPRDQPVRVLDLGCGIGSNLRYLTKNNPVPSSWLLVDEDARLLARVPAREGVTTMRRNLAALTPDLIEGQTLITASALLDLVSADWLRALVRYSRSAGAAVLFALTYDGRIECDPSEPEDDVVRELVNQHQHRDKGFGPALGPDAALFADRCFAAAGYRIRSAASDWVLRSERDLQRELIKGWADAAIAIAPDRAGTIAAWRRRRLAHVDAGRSRVLVGHQDFAAIPVSKRAERRGASLAERAGAGRGAPATDQRIRLMAGRSRDRSSAARCLRSQSKSTSPPIRNTR